MPIRNLLRELKLISVGSFPRSAFLIMFTTVVVGPLVLLVIGGNGTDTIKPLNLLWYFLAIISLLLPSISLGFLMFNHESRAAQQLSINLKHS